MSNDETYDTVLNSDKPDNKLEFFWLTFKDSIQNYLSESELTDLAEVSDNLNILQRQERYNEIEEFIKLHIERIGYGMMSKNDNYRLSHLETNLRRWNKLTGNEIYPQNNTFYTLLQVYQNLLKGNKNKKLEMDKMLSCIKDYSSDTTNHQHLINLMNLSIKNEMFGNIDKLRNILNIKQFIIPESLVKITDSYINTTKSHKLVKHMCELKMEKNNIKV